MVTTSSSVEIFDRKRLAAARARTQKQFGDYNFLHTWANARLAERLEDIRRDYTIALHIGPQAPALSVPHYYKMDGVQADVIAEEEFLPFSDGSLDLVTSTMSLHMVNDLPGALVQIRRALKPDGLFLAAMAGGETLHQLRACLAEAELALKGGISPRVYPFADKQQTGALLQRAGFNLPVVDSEMVTVTYDTIFKLFHDLRGMGQNNVISERSRTFTSRSLFMKAAEIYQSKYAEKDGRIAATFEIIFMIGWAPHESQQKPLRPGSATKRLADALGTDEIKTGQKATP